MLRSQNLLEEAYQSLKQAVSLAPENAYYNYALGTVAQQRADPAEAVPYFKKYCALRPQDPRGRLQLGITYFYSHQEDLAQKELAEAAQHRETAAAAHFRLGQAYVHLGKKDLAQKEFQLHHQFYERHLAEVDKQRSEIQQFVYSMKGAPAGP